MASEGKRVNSQRTNILTIAGLALVVRLSTLALLLVIPTLGLVPPFDSSARSIGALEGLVRWDVLHFLSTYRNGGRTVEQEWAFGQGIRWVLLLGRSIMPGKMFTEEQAAVFGGSLLAVLASVGSTVILFWSVVFHPFFDGLSDTHWFDSFPVNLASVAAVNEITMPSLTFELTASTQFSMLASLLHIFSPSPSTQVVVYTEPFFAFFTFAGMLDFARLQSNRRQRSRGMVHLLKFAIAGVWAIATSFRPLGVLMAGFWVWDWVERSFERIRRRAKRRLASLTAIGVEAFETALLVLVTCSPFLVDQFTAYQQFCVGLDSGHSPGRSARPWCSHAIPVIYPFVQSFYWDVGFLRYWTLAQLPNFAISSPLYFASFLGVATYYRASKPSCSRPFLTRRLAIHVHLQLALTILLFTNSHSQILLRQAASIPGIWWALADRVGAGWGFWPGEKLGRWWWVWCALWAPTSVLLWVGFYPPA